MRAWLRDTYLVAREPGALHFPTLLGAGGGSATFHEDGDRWLLVHHHASHVAGRASG